MNLSDFIWPRIEEGPPSLGSLDETTERWPHSEAWPEALAELKSLIAFEDERTRQVDHKLGLLIGVIPACIAFLLTAAGWLLTQNHSSLVTSSVPLLLGSGGMVCYSGVQLFASFLAALRGLGRRGFAVPSISVLVPLAEEPQVDYCRRLFRTLSECLTHNREVNNSKVDGLAVAHVAMRNAIGAAAIVSVGAAIRLVAFVFIGI